MLESVFCLIKRKTTEILYGFLKSLFAQKRVHSSLQSHQTVKDSARRFAMLLQITIETNSRDFRIHITKGQKDKGCYNVVISILITSWPSLIVAINHNKQNLAFCVSHTHMHSTGCAGVVFTAQTAESVPCLYKNTDWNLCYLSLALRDPSTENINQADG